MDQAPAPSGGELRTHGAPVGDLYFDDIITSVNDGDANGQPTAVVAAAGKWKPGDHPRGKDGKFIEKGALQELLSVKAPNVFHAANAADELTPEKWNKLTPEQQTYVQEKLSKLPPSSDIGKKAAAKLAEVTAKPSPMQNSAIKHFISEVMVPTTTEQNEAFDALDQETWDALPPGGQEKFEMWSAYDPDHYEKVQQLKKGAGKKAGAHKGVAPGSPAKITTALVWGKHEPGTVILEDPNASDTYVEWDGKKYIHVVDAEIVDTWTKKDAYANLKGQTHWVVPGVDVTPVPEEGDVSPVNWSQLAGDLEAGKYPPGAVIAVRSASDDVDDVDNGELRAVVDGDSVDVVDMVTGDVVASYTWADVINGNLGSDYPGEWSIESPEQPDWVDELLEPMQPKPTGWEGVAETELQKQWEKGLLTSEEFEQVTGKQPTVEPKLPTSQAAPGNPLDKFTAAELAAYQSYEDEAGAAGNADDAWQVFLDVKPPGMTDQQFIDVMDEIAHYKLFGGEYEGGPGFFGVMFAQHIGTGDMIDEEAGDFEPELELTSAKLSLKATHNYVVKAKASHPDGAVIAVANNGKFRIRKSGSKYVSETRTSGGNWQFVGAIANIDVIKNVRSDDWGVPVSAFEQFMKPEKVVPPSGFELGVTPPKYTSQDVISNWPGLLQKKFTYGDTVALSADGKYRVVVDISGFFEVQKKDQSAGWVYVDQGITTTVADKAQKLAHTWVVPLPKTPTPPPPLPVVPSAPSTATLDPDDQITDWKALAEKAYAGDYAAGDPIAHSANGSYTLVAGDGNASEFHVVGTYTEMILTSISAKTLENGGVENQYGKWYVSTHTKTTGHTGASPAASMTPKPDGAGHSISPLDAFFVGLGLADDTVVAVGMPVSDTKNTYRLRSTTSLTGAKVLDLQIKNNAGGWSSLGSYKNSAEYDADWGKSIKWFKFNKPTAPAESGPQPTTAPKSADAPGSVYEVTPADAATFKAKMKAAGVGYWSKPEKIWDQVKEIQKGNVRPENPKQAKFSPLQILKSLDAQLKTAEPSPYVKKVNKWAGTPTGSAYIKKNKGSPTAVPSPAAQGAPEPFTGSGYELWEQAQKSNVGDVLLQGVGSDGNLYQIVATSAHGSGMLTALHKYNPSTDDWTHVKTHPFSNLLQATVTDPGFNWYVKKVAQPAAPLVPAGLVGHPLSTDTNVNVTYTLKNNPKISNEEIFEKLKTALPGQVLAYGKNKYNNTKFRLVAHQQDDGTMVVKRENWWGSGGGSWYGGITYKSADSLSSAMEFSVPDSSWVTAENAKIIKPKGPPKPAVAKSAASVKTTAPIVEPFAGQLNIGGGDISHLTEAKKDALYQTFKKQPATYLDSPPGDIFAAAKTIAGDEGLDLLQMLRVIDAAGAKKFGVQDQHLFEKKITDWLKTPQGAAMASGKPIPLPPSPQYAPGVDPDSQVPSFEVSQKYTYGVVSYWQANSAWQKSLAAHGEWTSTQSSALKTYTGGSYYSMNAYLYGVLDSVSATHMKAIKNAQLGMRPSVEPMLLHREVGFGGIGNAKTHADLQKLVGTTWQSGGFFSTSVGGKAAFTHSVVIEVEAPPGTPMAWVDPISQHKGENEMLLAAGLHYRIISVKKVGHKSVVRVRVVPAPKEEP